MTLDPISEYLAEAVPRVKAKNAELFRSWGLVGGSTISTNFYSSSNITSAGTISAGLNYITYTYSSSNTTDLYKHFVTRWLDIPDSKNDG